MQCINRFARFAATLALGLALAPLTGCGGDEKADDPVVTVDAGSDVVTDSGVEDVTPETDAGEEEQDAGPTGPVAVDDLTDGQLFAEYTNYLSFILSTPTNCVPYILATEYTEAFANVQPDEDSFFLEKMLTALQESVEAGSIGIDAPSIRCAVKVLRPMLMDVLDTDSPEEKCRLFFKDGSNEKRIASFNIALADCGQDYLSIDEWMSVLRLTPKVEDNGSCRHSMECISGQCDLISSASNPCDGKCAPTPTIGDACSRNRDCPGDLICINQQCQLPGEKDAACTDDQHCKDDLICGANNKCREKSGEGNGCTQTTQCADGLYCKTDTLNCVATLPEKSTCTLDEECGKDSVCQTIVGGVSMCYKLKALGENCVIEGLSFQNRTCGDAYCSPEGVCIEEDTRTEGQICSVQNTDTITDYGCIRGYTCNEENKCEKLSEIGEACSDHFDCFDLATDENVRDFFTKSAQKADNKFGLTDVRCVASPVAGSTTDVCEHLKDVGGACMANFKSSKSGCKGDLICMPNENPDEYGFTGTCTKAPGVDEKCITHTAYSSPLCDSVVAYPDNSSSEDCICRALSGHNERCEYDNHCAAGLSCKEGFCLSWDDVIPNGCILINDGLH